MHASEHRSSPAWSALRAHHAKIADAHLRELFARDPERAKRLRLEACGLFLDYSRHRITDETLAGLLALAEEAGLEDWIARLFAGEAVNVSEDRPALHMALRRLEEGPFPPAKDVMPPVRGTREKMRAFCRQVRSHRWRGVAERPVDTVVHLGIGGSGLGPAMACAALETYADAGIAVHFVSDLDGAALARVLRRCEPERTLFIVASKSFRTGETLANAAGAGQWLAAKLGDGADVRARHFIAVTAAPERAREFGIDPDNVFEIWDWVGGRFSLWSAVGLPVALSIGMEGFEALLAGAAEMDAHFMSAPPAANMPVILALLEVWYRNFFGAGSRVVLPYDHALRRFPEYLQQLEMESNGKGVSRAGAALARASAPVVWGAPGIDAQHAFFQLLHQGGDLIPADFLIPLQSQAPLEGHHESVLASALAQARVLMRGRSEAEVAAGLGTDAEAGPGRARIAHRVMPGNRPSSLLIYDRLDPRTLGALAALYEHKVFVESVLWGTNPFDQFGVELGKKVAEEIRPAVAKALAASAGGKDTFSERVERLLSACPAQDE